MNVITVYVFYTSIFSLVNMIPAPPVNVSSFMIYESIVLNYSNCRRVQMFLEQYEILASAKNKGYA
jgi:hypothetical protein